MSEDIKQMTRLLFTAVMSGDLEKVASLLAAGADVDAGDKYEATVLMYAAKSGNLDIAKLLLAARADVNAADKNGTTALLNATKSGNVDIAKLLLAARADVNAADKNGTTALLNAADLGNVDIAKLLLANGADVNAENTYKATALMYASCHGNVDIAKLLLAARADVNVGDENGLTVLMYAANSGNVDIAKLLLANGADLNARNAMGYTALTIALEGGNEEIAQLLLDRGATFETAEDVAGVDAAPPASLAVVNDDAGAQKAAGASAQEQDASPRIIEQAAPPQSLFRDVRNESGIRSLMREAVRSMATGPETSMYIDPDNNHRGLAICHLLLWRNDPAGLISLMNFASTHIDVEDPLDDWHYINCADIVSYIRYRGLVEELDTELVNFVESFSAYLDDNTSALERSFSIFFHSGLHSGDHNIRVMTSFIDAAARDRGFISSELSRNAHWYLQSLSAHVHNEGDLQSLVREAVEGISSGDDANAIIDPDNHYFWLSICHLLLWRNDPAGLISLMNFSMNHHDDDNDDEVGVEGWFDQVVCDAFRFDSDGADIVSYIRGRGLVEAHDTYLVNFLESFNTYLEEAITLDLDRSLAIFFYITMHLTDHEAGVVTSLIEAAARDIGFMDSALSRNTHWYLVSNFVDHSPTHSTAVDSTSEASMAVDDGDSAAVDGARDSAPMVVDGGDSTPAAPGVVDDTQGGAGENTSSGFSFGAAAMVVAAVAAPVIAGAIDTDNIRAIAGDVLNNIVDNVVNRIGDMAEVAVEAGVGCMLGVSSSCS
ncbi:MAG: ankyrin repeat domain-containing protein [Rickettsiaceae bacterium]|nr:ankyrin repeat domain-containing protein [Rickettsiaceae bacterium]